MKVYKFAWWFFHRYFSIFVHDDKNKNNIIDDINNVL